MPSRFLHEIPEDQVVKKGGYHPKPERSACGGTSGRFDDGWPNYGRPAAPQPKKTVIYPAAASAQKATYLEVNKGDMVEHTAFGRGMVLSVMKMGGDALLEIAFDKIGTKKLMAKTASAHMKKL